MLFEEVDKVIRTIERVDPKKDTPAFCEEMIRNCSAAFDKVRSAQGPENAKQLLLLNLASVCIMKLIVPLPEKLKQMSALVKDRSRPLPARCMLAGSLAYLVQPNDLIPDSAKGGYGFVDDSVLVHAFNAEYMRITGANAASVRESAQLAMLASGICPPGIVDVLNSTVTSIGMGFQLLSQLPAQLLELTLQQTIANPYQAAAQTVTPAGMPSGHVAGWSPSVPLRNSMGMTFSAGGGTMMATFADGDSVVLGS